MGIIKERTTELYNSIGRFLAFLRKELKAELAELKSIKWNIENQQSYVKFEQGIVNQLNHMICIVKEIRNKAWLILQDDIWDKIISNENMLQTYFKYTLAFERAVYEDEYADLVTRTNNRNEKWLDIDLDVRQRLRDELHDKLTLLFNIESRVSEFCNLFRDDELRWINDPAFDD